MKEFDISIDGLLKVLGILKPHKEDGPDNVYPFMPWHLCVVIAPVLQVVFTQSYKTGQLPNTGHITIHASIINLCVCSKMLEQNMLAS